jgi:hypothetical protein
LAAIQVAQGQRETLFRGWVFPKWLDERVPEGKSLDNLLSGLEPVGNSQHSKRIQPKVKLSDPPFVETKLHFMGNSWNQGDP